MQIPATFSTATVSPCLAIRVKRVALPFKLDEKDENTSFYISEITSVTFHVRHAPLETPRKSNMVLETYRVVDRVMIPCVVMDINGDGSEGRNL